MFAGFANVWTPVAAESSLRAGRPLALEVARTPIVLFRDERGAPAALVDRCPHRGVALSLGKVTDGRIECPFHGWRFAASGANCHVPWNPDAKRNALGATSIPAREIAGQVWVFTGPAASAGEPEVHDTFLRSDVRLCGFEMGIEAHWTRAMENMLDWPHLPFVHARTIGKGMEDGEAGRMDIHMEPRPWGFHTQISVDGAARPGALQYRWPNRMNLFIPIPGKTMVMQVACVPVSESRTRMVFLTARDFLKLGVLDRFFDWQNRRIANEDREVVESSFPSAVPRAAEERSVRTDAPTLYFRRRYFAELHDSEVVLPQPLMRLERRESDAVPA